MSECFRLEAAPVSRIELRPYGYEANTVTTMLLFRFYKLNYIDQTRSNDWLIELKYKSKTVDH